MTAKASFFRDSGSLKKQFSPEKPKVHRSNTKGIKPNTRVVSQRTQFQRKQTNGTPFKKNPTTGK